MDRWGAVASSLCAIHCAVCAFAPLAFGALGLGVLLSHEAEWGLTLVAIAFGAGALFMSWRQHRSTMIASLLAIGIVGLLAARALEMGAGHHDHHDDHHGAEAGHVDGEHHDDHAEENHDDHAEENHDDHADNEHAAAAEGHGRIHRDSEHADGHGDEEDSLHAVGGTVGFAAGLLLVSGHLLNIRTARRRRDEDECCD